MSFCSDENNSIIPHFEFDPIDVVNWIHMQFVLGENSFVSFPNAMMTVDGLAGMLADRCAQNTSK